VGENEAGFAGFAALMIAAMIEAPAYADPAPAISAIPPSQSPTTS